MQLTPLKRQDLLNIAVHHTGQSLLHQSGPARGKPLGQRRVSRIISRFIDDQKRLGRLIEMRPIVSGMTLDRAKAPTRRAHFVFVPQTIDMFAELAHQDRKEQAALRSRDKA